MEDEEILEKLFSRDDLALEELQKKYGSRLLGLAGRFLRSREDAEDVTSDFFIRLWDIADTYRPGKGHRAWMITIAHNMAVDYLRRRKREIPVEEDGEDLNN